MYRINIHEEENITIQLQGKRGRMQDYRRVKGEVRNQPFWSI